MFHYFYVFFQSMGMELLLIAVYLKLRSRRKILESCGIVFMANAATHTAVIFLLMRLGSYLESVIVAEIFAPVVEALIYRQTFLKNTKEAFVVSVIVNLVSWQLGPIFTFWLWH